MLFLRFSVSRLSAVRNTRRKGGMAEDIIRSMSIIASDRENAHTKNITPVLSDKRLILMTINVCLQFC